MSETISPSVHDPLPGPLVSGISVLQRPAAHLDARTTILLLLAVSLAVSCMLNWILFQERDWLRQAKSATDEKIVQLIQSERTLILDITGRNNRELGQLAQRATDGISNAAAVRSMESVPSGTDLISVKEAPFESDKTRSK